tara:strand:- start:10526 stop:10999 length:474 start_codon:yes stop_codon:yes gene_type:complete
MIMRNFLYTPLFLACILIVTSTNAQIKQSKSASFYQYETECLEDKLDGNFVFMAWGSGSSKKEAIDQAKRNAINDILFKGVNKSTCSVRPLITEVQAREKYRDYIAEFFRKDYSKYINIEQSTKSKKKSRSQTTYGVKVKIDVAGIRYKLKTDQIIK